MNKEREVVAQKDRKSILVSGDLVWFWLEIQFMFWGRFRGWQRKEKRGFQIFEKIKIKFWGFRGKGFRERRKLRINPKK